MPTSNDTELSFGDYLQVLGRRFWLFCVVAGAIVLIGVAIAYRVPPTYESSGVLLVERPAVPENVVSSTVPDYPAERVRIITQRVLTEDNLKNIINENDLYPELADSPGRAVSQLRNSVELSAEDPELLEDILGTQRSESSMAFSLSFGHSRPDVARDVSRDLVSLYLEENRRARQEQASETTAFLQDEAERLEEEIAEREQRLADFKQEHAESLPELNDMNMQLLDRTERELEDVEREIRSLRERRSLYSNELAQLSPHAAVTNEEGQTVLGPSDRLEVLQREYMRLSAVYSAEHPDVQRVRREIEALSESTGLPAFSREVLQSELAAQREELAAARDRYSDDHPDVQRLQSRVENLEAQLREAPGRSGAAASGSTPPDNPAYIQKQVQLEAVRSELQAALDRREELRTRLENLESRLTNTPEVERQFSSLQRGYEQLLGQYEEVQRQLREAQSALSLESESRGERFTMLSAPGLPSRPSHPNRIAVLLLTAVLATALGAGSVATAESLDTTVRSARDISTHLEIPPLAAIPQVYNAEDEHRLYVRRFFAAAAAGVWAGVIVFLVMTPAG